MAEQYVQVPVSLIERIEATTNALRHMPVIQAGSGIPDITFNLNVVTEHFNAIFAAVDEATNLLSQPTPSAELDDRDKVLDWFLALNTCPDDASRLARLAQALGYAKSFGFVWPHRAEFDPSTIRDITPPAPTT